MFPTFAKSTIRARINQNLTQACTIKRWSEGVGDYGEPTRTISNEIESACFLTRAAGGRGQNMITDADKGRVFYMLQFPYDTDIQDGDTVTINSERYDTKQVMRSHDNNVMRQALLVKAGS